MRITRLDVDGFGTLAGLSVDGVSPNLTVIAGPNEVGKSTLLDFIRFILFGFPRGRGAARREPLHGGRHGGALRLCDDEGSEWTVERHGDQKEAVVAGPGGLVGGEQELRLLLGGADATVFRTVFAFGLGELVSLENLASDEVRDLIFTAGVLGAGRSATKAMRDLSERRSELMKPRARSARANDLAHRLETTRRQLRARRELAAGFPAAAARLRSLAKGSATAAQLEDGLAKRRGELDELLAAWPSWQRLVDAENRLAHLDSAPDSDAVLIARSAEIRSMVAERSGYLGRLEKVETLERQLEGIEKKVLDLTDQRDEAIENCEAIVPRPREKAEIRADQQRLRSIGSLAQQRDQASAIRLQRDAMLVAARAARRPPLSGGLIAALGIAVVVAAIAGLAAVLRHQTLIGGLAFTIAAAVLVVIAIAFGERRRGFSDRDELSTDPSPITVDIERLNNEIARLAFAVGLAATPLLSEIESETFALAEELDRRDRLEHEVMRTAEIESELEDLQERRSTVLGAIAAEQSQVADFEKHTAEVADAAGIAFDSAPAVMCLRIASAFEAADGRAIERHTLEASVSTSRSNLAETIGTAEKADRMLAMLGRGDRSAWEIERDRAIEEIETARAAWREARDEETAAARELRELEGSDEIARLELDVAALTEELQETLSEWLTLGVAHDILRETVERYERERQPAVIAKASALFSLVTGGHYEQLIAREDDRGSARTVLALSRSGSLVDAASLSRGTAEQLYLCLRLGLASAHAERSTALPFVLDDVLVNFDPERAAAVARVIAETADSHQVIVFTCHPHVSEILARARPDCRVFELASRAPAGDLGDSG
jgi:uncharacterized protein YhaN